MRLLPSTLAVSLLVGVVGLAFGFSGCTLEAEGTGTPLPGSDSGLGGASGSGGSGGVECFPGSKVCKDTTGTLICVAANSPDKGCGQATCSPCVLNHATAKCGVNGDCVVDQCDPGYTDCDGLAANGCEAKLDADPKNCGTCKNDCIAQKGKDWTCEAGQCVVAECVPATTSNCNGDKTDGCEVDLATDPQNCGFCGNACNLPHAVAGCAGGKCGISSCVAPWVDCDGNPDNGCERNLDADPQNCGFCGTICNSNNGVPGCSGGKCLILCTPPWADCDGNLANGCETNRNTSAAHCGGCGNVCSSVNGVPSCGAGKCGITCNAPFGNCDNNVANGCETNRSTSVQHCGTCGTACSAQNGTPSCAGGVCSITCQPGYANCDGNVANGCEVNLTTNPNHCGACGAQCSSVNGTASCSAGKCAIACSAGFGNCDGNVANGCETNLNSNATNCGSCGKVCGGTNGTPFCSAGNCGIVCSAGFGNCDGNAANGCEVVLSSSVSHCGTCGNACSGTNGTPGCTAGSCTIGCSAGFGNCDGAVQNGCEANLNGSVLHCGGCGNACSTAGGTPSCSGGACGITCTGAFANCDGSAANGCEVDKNSNVLHCGACGNACSSTGGTPSCTGGACAITCTAPFMNCDGSVLNGCEVNTGINVLHCGTCGNACSSVNGTPSCNGGACSIACSGTFADCDGDVGTGCETDLSTSFNHCGACFAPCTGTQTCSGGVCS